MQLVDDKIQSVIVTKTFIGTYEMIFKLIWQSK